MKIPLRNFEQLIDPAILKRGLAYFKKGLVEQEGEGVTGDLSFIVHGSEDYAVELMVKGDMIEDFTCDCPYTDGPVCKHIVSIIFYLLKDELQLSEPVIAPKRAQHKRGRPRAARLTIPDESLNDALALSKGQENKTSSPKKAKETTTRKPKKASVKTQIASILQQLTPEDITDYLVHVVLIEKSNQADFLAHFASKNEHESAETYRAQIKAILSKAKGRYGYIEYKDALQVGKAVFAIAIRGLEHAENGNFRSAMLISMAVLEEMTQALQFVDDSNGDVGGNIETAFHVLLTISEKKLPPGLRHTLFDYAIAKYNDSEFEGWNWHLGMIDIASNLAKDEEEVNLLISLLNQPVTSDYDLDSRQSMIYALLLKRKDKTEAQDFLRRNLHNPDLRKIALQQAFARGDYAQVNRMAVEGIAEDQTNYPGLLSDWYDWLIKTAITEDKTEKVIEYARLQFLKHGSEKLKYVDLIRQHTPAAEWRAVYISLLNEMSGSDNWHLRSLIPDLIIAEQDWPNLFIFLKTVSANHSIGFSMLMRYGKHLLNTHKEEIGQLMEKSILNVALIAGTRRDYSDLAKDLRQMKKMGFSEQVHKLVSHFMTVYKHRPAMMEEIGKV